jgi:hypothetical protein
VVIVGVDPGMSGGLARFDGTDVVCWRMPVAAERLDFARLADVLRGADLVAVETPFAPRGRERGAMQSWRRFGQLEALAWLVNATVLEVTPTRWQSALAGWAREPGEDTKDAARRWVRQRYGSALMLPGRCKTEHDGIADAVCIGSWAAQVVAARGQR